MCICVFSGIFQGLKAAIGKHGKIATIDNRAIQTVDETTDFGQKVPLLRGFLPLQCLRDTKIHVKTCDAGLGGEIDTERRELSVPVKAGRLAVLTGKCRCYPA